MNVHLYMAKGKKKRDNNHNVLVAEFRVSMHCNACERSVAKAISKLKGVETFVTDMPRQRVTVRGRINSEKVVKKIRKKTGKRAEILSIEQVDGGKCSEKEEGDSALLMQESAKHAQIQQPLVLDPCWDSEVYRMFSDENPNACSTM